ncbi:Btp1 [Penicillium lagena]|uniref:Btp1 n=1 Tax=Penicillium lagena TaxID=94218 RepID=UPI0025407385|nr:Btp1 [Penicillium lagena]KAJ5625396.1 Btp1 [Penicillium lagena]
MGGPQNIPDSAFPFPGAGPPPKGVTPNFTNPPSIGWKFEAAAWPLWTIGFIFVLLRLYSGIHTGQGRIKWDNVFMAFAIVLALARVIILTVEVEKYGMGRHVWNLPRPWMTIHRSIIYIGDMFYLPSMMFAKLSILLVYKRLFGISRSLRMVVYFMMGLMVVYTVVMLFIYGFNCRPPYEYWGWHMTMDVAWTESHCFDFPTMNLGMGGVNIITDTVILLLPMPFVWKLQLRPMQKFGLCLVFGAGAFTVAASCVREYFVYATERNADQSYNEVIQTTWLTVELMVGIIAVSLPAIGPVYQKVIRDSRIGTSLRNLLSRLTPSKNSSQASHNSRAPRISTMAFTGQRSWLHTTQSHSSAGSGIVPLTNNYSRSGEYARSPADPTLATQV